MGLWIQETFVNETENYIFGEAPLYETYHESLGKLFRSLQKEYGRCVSRTYIDTRERDAIPIGWVFSKVMAYEDSRPRYDDYGRRVKPETYERGVWVTVHVKDTDVIRVPHVMNIDTQEEVARG